MWVPFRLLDPQVQFMVAWWCLIEFELHATITICRSLKCLHISSLLGPYDAHMVLIRVMQASKTPRCLPSEAKRSEPGYFSLLQRLLDRNGIHVHVWILRGKKKQKRIWFALPESETNAAGAAFSFHWCRYSKDDVNILFKRLEGSQHFSHLGSDM